MPRLSIQLPDGSEKTIVLPKNGEYFARIGRDEHCEIVLPFQSVSGEHALLQFKEGAYVLEDLGSTNGIKINGSRPWVPPLFTMATKLPWEMPGSGLPKSLLRDSFPSRPKRGGRGSSFRHHAEFAAIGGRGHPYGAEELFVDGPCMPS